MKAGYFDIKRDIEIVNNGGFFCQGCLIGKPLSKQSPKDARYCIDCQPVIEYEYALAAEHRGRKSRYSEPALRELDVDKEKEVLLPTNLENTHEYQKEARPPLLPSRGRPRKTIPIDLIHKLSKQGVGVKKIARELNISAMTISRVLSGERTN